MESAEKTYIDINSENRSVRSLILSEIDTLKQTMQQHISDNHTNRGLSSDLSLKMDMFKEKLNEIEKAAKKLRKPEKLNKIRREVILCKIRLSGNLQAEKLKKFIEAPMSELNVDIDVARERLKSILEAKRALENSKQPDDLKISKKEIFDKQINAFLLALVYGLHFAVTKDSYVRRNPDFLRKQFIEGGGYTRRTVFALLKTRAQILKNMKRMTEYRLKSELVAAFDHLNEVVIPETERRRQTRRLRAMALKELLIRKKVTRAEEAH